MEVENWRNRELSDEALAEVKKMLFSLPRAQWSLARQLPPLSLVKIKVQDYPETYGTVLDYGFSPSNGLFVVSAILDKEGQITTNANGNIQAAVTTVNCLTLLTTCGQITTKWMNQHFCDS